MRCRSHRMGATLVAALMVAVAAGGAAAQGPGGPGGPGRGRRMGPMMGPRPMTAATVPVPLLERTLNLTADQKAQIVQIQEQFRQAVRDTMPPRPEPGSGPPDPPAMKAAQDKIKAIDAAYSAKVVALLSADQQTGLTKLLRDLNDFQIVGLPAQAVPKLGLTADQLAQIHAIAATARAAEKATLDASTGDPRTTGDALQQIHRKAHEDVLASLTDAQRATLEQFAPAGRGRRGPGGPGGFGGPGGPPPGGEMGPPPGGPDGGPGGPPPDGPAPE